MTSRALALLVFLSTLSALALACANSETKPASNGDAGGDALPTTNLTCQQIRLCIFSASCADDACVASCAAKGTAAAQATFAALRTCTANACSHDLNCACVEQCQANGRCLSEADACLGAATFDDICDQICA